MRLLFLLYVLLPFSAAQAANTLMLAEIYEDSVLVVIDGSEVVLPIGEVVEDIRLIETMDRGALFDINGQRQRLSILSSIQIAPSYYQRTQQRVSITQSGDGHYWVTGQINSRSVSFLVDTGASNIAINESTARKLGVNMQSARRVLTQTANGSVQGWLVVLSRIVIGDIVEHDVEAIVIPDTALPVALLGNSFLNRLEFQVKNGTMILQK